ncbi:protein prenyltransferase alpha subunit repeat-containing protein 1-like [Styela clava]
MQNQTWSYLELHKFVPSEESIHLGRKIFHDFLKACDSINDIKSIEIIPSNAEENTSPIVIEGDHIGVKLWCIPLLFKYAYNALMNENLDIQEIEKLSRCVVFCCPDCTTAWNERKNIILMNSMNDKTNLLRKELALSRLVLMQRPKSSETFAHRRWVVLQIMRYLLKDFDSLNQYNNAGNTGNNDLSHDCSNILNFDIETLLDLVRTELSVCCLAGEKQKSNYNAWAHRAWVVDVLFKFACQLYKSKEFLSCACVDTSFRIWQNIISFLSTDVNNMRFFSEKHISDISILTAAIYVQFQWANLIILPIICSEKCCKFSEFSKTNISTISTVFIDSLHHNEKLLELYDAHEALWCHRRIILTSFHKILETGFVFLNEKNFDSVMSKFSQESETKFCQKFCKSLPEKVELSEYQSPQPSSSDVSTAKYYSLRHFTFVCNFLKNNLALLNNE